MLNDKSSEFDVRLSIKPSKKTWSLRRISILLLALLCIPPSIASLTSYVRAQDIQQQISDINLKTLAIDNVIASEVTSPFYLSQVITPCSDQALQNISQNIVQIEARTVQYIDRLFCEWTYKLKDNSSPLLATDIWGIYQYESQDKDYFYISARYYYSDQGTRIALDVYQPTDECFRKRFYYDESGKTYAETVCFSESGEALDRAISAPIPPMLYWFFYR